ncbi:MAG TPA: Asp-tRNA(Asn)/Glu-tRNA(Gln) amidotransferase subunit GatA [Candidatus Saccharimonadales bacterium]|nr:Asp-tRNA(Asn)/Glu-tRNA(Gln) amidotransferase subunit GatA [Candidatus Saccharimonadales bacterium]
MRSRIDPIVSDVSSGKKSVTQIVEDTLTRIEKASEYHAVLETARERALQRAGELDRKIADGQDVGRLAGVTFVVKDNILTFGTKTTASSKILDNFEAPYQATVIERLEAEGAIMVAKTNLDSFAHGSSTENSAFGPTHNPHDKERVPGGSSGGSAAAVALDLVPFALGTDTGGSVRQPAALCGVVGFKPTFGAVSRYGAVAMASSTDVISPLTHSIGDARIILDIMGGQDTMDSTSHTVDTKKGQTDLKSLRVGVIKQNMGAGVDPEVLGAVNKAIDKLKVAGAMIEEVDMPILDLALAIYYIVVPAEVSSNLMRYDGIKFGHTANGQFKSIEEYQSMTRSEGFMPENVRRIMIGTYVLSSGYYDAYYKRALQARTLLIRDFEEAFKKYDVLISPTTPTTAFKLGQNTDDPLKMYLADVMTVGMNLAGLPSVSIPAGNDSSGLPIGVLLSGAQKDDASVLDIAEWLEGDE